MLFTSKWVACDLTATRHTAFIDKLHRLLFTQTNTCVCLFYLFQVILVHLSQIHTKLVHAHTQTFGFCSTDLCCRTFGKVSMWRMPSFSPTKQWRELRALTPIHRPVPFMINQFLPEGNTSPFMPGPMPVPFKYATVQQHYTTLPPIKTLWIHCHSIQVPLPLVTSWLELQQSPSQSLPLKRAQCPDYLTQNHCESQLQHKSDQILFASNYTASTSIVKAIFEVNLG